MNIAEIIKLLPGNEAPVKFDSPIIVKSSPHRHLVSIFGAVATKGEGLCIYDGNKWHEVLPGQANVDYVLNSLYQRLKMHPVK